MKSFREFLEESLEEKVKCCKKDPNCKSLVEDDDEEGEFGKDEAPEKEVKDREEDYDVKMTIDALHKLVEFIKEKIKDEKEDDVDDLVSNIENHAKENSVVTVKTVEELDDKDDKKEKEEKEDEEGDEGVEESCKSKKKAK